MVLETETEHHRMDVMDAVEHFDFRNDKSYMTTLVL